MSEVVRSDEVPAADPVHPAPADIKSPMRHSMYAAATLVLCAAAFWLAITSRSWTPLQMIALLLLIGTLVNGSASTLAARRMSADAKDAFVPFHIAVVSNAAAFMLMGILSMVERPLWFGMDSPDLLVKQKYTAYSVNDHRILKWACSDKQQAIWIRTIDDTTYARCGAWFPNTYTVSAKREEFERAAAATAGEPDKMPIVLNPKK